ncbi:hypothetical protein PAXINDRAFT_91934 [Paxillus involutus ATCC 200175]|uniref:Uncharacterized protein n=1 Tax=Paxillus involutus ATCC 200175 TaxID=664439 RepID=A0A0C9SMN2_PAXIN|nr:hypothetical protein PAXINDRAFT_91934 [Paxillus involutus ATCC 200175]
MQGGEPTNFLRLSAALKIFCGSSIKLDMLPRAEELLQGYLFGFKQMYGAESMKPNFHWAVHLAQQIRDYGPVYNFWAFLSERLNKVLKSSNSNNWTGGQIEISMMREFARGSRLDSLVRAVLPVAENTVAKALLEQMLGEGHEASGTVQDATTDLYAIQRVQLGPQVSLVLKRLSDTARAAICRHHNSKRPGCVHLALQTNPPPGSQQLNDFATFFEYGLLEGRRITPLSRSIRNSAGSSLVKVVLGEKTFYGEVINLFTHVQQGITSGTRLLAEFRWMIELDLVPVEDDIWNEFPELDIQCFALNKYWIDGDAEAPPAVLPFDFISCQIARGTIDTTNPPMWIVTSLDRVCLQHFVHELLILISYISAPQCLKFEIA